MTSTTRALGAAAVAAVLFTSGCSAFDATDLNNPGLDELENSPTPTSINTAATGILIGLRGSWGVQNGFIPLLAILGREGYNLDPADPRGGLRRPVVVVRRRLHAVEDHDRDVLHVRLLDQCPRDRREPVIVGQ